MSEPAVSVRSPPLSPTLLSAATFLTERPFGLAAYPDSILWAILRSASTHHFLILYGPSHFPPPLEKNSGDRNPARLTLKPPPFTGLRSRDPLHGGRLSKPVENHFRRLRQPRVVWICQRRIQRIPQYDIPTWGIGAS
jgi:hypothetical protein